MYAIIETGGKQYRVEQNDIIDVELLDTAEDGKIEFKNVLFIGNGSDNKMGAPYLSEYAVKAELVGEVKGPKVVAFKYKKRKRYRRKVGHRQCYLRVKITEIAG
ncbi:MAG: 50S ribosomal protein L21 [Verrucomicrobia bacterium]|nr:50S ribosomal protein L21 [Verrucomicrobiota bacterium]